MRDFFRAGCALALACCALAAQGDEGAAMPTGFLNVTTEADGETRREVIYVPAEYTPEQAWPMIVFLHGAGERGDDGLIQTEVGLGDAIRRHADRFPAIVLFPQCPAEKYWNSTEAHLDALMEQARERYNINENRVYLTGLSMGGYGCWTWGAAHAERWAAMIPICGGGEPNDLKSLTKEPIPKEAYPPMKERVLALAKLPIWTFHGLEDDVVPPFRTKQMVRMIEREGGEIKHTEYKGVGHASWERAYADEDVIRWLFEQQRKL